MSNMSLTNQTMNGKVSSVLYELKHVLIVDIIGSTGFINAQIIKTFIAPAELKEKVKVFVCGNTNTNNVLCRCYADLLSLQAPLARSQLWPVKRLA